jgi:hypothetical protein
MHNIITETQDYCGSCLSCDKLQNLFNECDRRFNQQAGLQISDEHIPKRFDKNKTMTTKGGITLLNFFVYNSEYSPREGEVCFFSLSVFSIQYSMVGNPIE